MDKNKEISRRILDYLNKHPDAGDTLEGITDWWLESERVDQALIEVSEVLEVLLKKGFLKQVKYRNKTVLYKPTKK